MEIKKDFYPQELAEALYKAAGRHEDEHKSGIVGGLYRLLACAENEKNNDYFRELWQLLQDVAEDQERRRYSVVIDVAGGMVQNVYSDAPAAVEIYDEDTDEFDEDAAQELAACEAVYKKIW